MNMILEELRKKYQDKLNRFCLMDDVFMNKVFEDKSCAKILIQTIIEKVVDIIEEKTQYAVNNLQGRSARLDIWAIDDNGKIYNIEVQNDNEDASPKRARYNSSLIDANVLHKGENWNILPETFVVFITRNDIFNLGRPIYHINRCIEEDSYNLFNDDSHIIYVNSSIQDDTNLGRLMHDFYCSKPDDMFNKVLANRSRHFKESEEGVSNMCSILREVEQETNIRAVKNIMAKSKYSLDEALELMGVPENERESIRLVIDKKGSNCLDSTTEF